MSCYKIFPKYNDKVCFCFASDETYVKYLGVALYSLAFNSNPNRNYDLIIFSNGISKLSKERLLFSLKQCVNISIRFVDIKDLVSNYKLYTVKYLNISTYARFFIFDFLDSYEKVVYLDTDLVVLSDVYELSSIDVSNFFVAAVKDLAMVNSVYSKNNLSVSNIKYNCDILGLDSPENYFNAGVVVYNIQKMIRNGISTKKMFDIAQSRKWRWLDQDVLNMVCGGKVLFLNYNWNVMVKPRYDLNFLPKTYFDSFNEARKNPFILHFSGGKIFPTFCYAVEYNNLFWKYALESAFYNELLYETITSVSKSKKLSNLLKRIFPKGTKRGRFVRKIYYSLKPKK